MKVQPFCAWTMRSIFLWAPAAVMLASVASARDTPTTLRAGPIQSSPRTQGSGGKKLVKIAGEDTPMRWPPPNVDATTPAVTPGVLCPSNDVLEAAGQHAKELTANLERFTAIERVEDVLFKKDGKAGPPLGRSFNYMVLISVLLRGEVAVDERREGSGVLAPNDIAENCLVTSALIFHPSYANDFDTVCEGLGDWRGHPAWQVHFAQRSDRLARFHGFVEGAKTISIRLKGRAWILRDSYQVAHLEQDMLAPIPRAHLMTEHIVTDYRPVEFGSRKLQLWLPDRVDLYLDYHGHHYYQRHQLSNSLLFSVETGQQIEPPRQRE